MDNDIIDIENVLNIDSALGPDPDSDEEISSEDELAEADAYCKFNGEPKSLSPELCKLLDVPLDTRLSRINIKTRIFQHIADNIQDPKNIGEDETIGPFFKNATTDEIVKYYNTQIFFRPVSMTVELCKLLGVPLKTRLNRVEITWRLCKYIKDHNLLDPENKRQFIVDEGLGTVFKKPGEKGQFYELHVSMSPHILGDKTKLLDELHKYHLKNM